MHVGFVVLEWWLGVTRTWQDALSMPFCDKEKRGSPRVAPLTRALTTSYFAFATLVVSIRVVAKRTCTAVCFTPRLKREVGTKTTIVCWTIADNNQNRSQTGVVRCLCLVLGPLSCTHRPHEETR